MIIIDIIGSIDDKIENNEKIIDSLYKYLDLEMKKMMTDKKIPIGDCDYISFCKSGITVFDKNKIYLDTSCVNNKNINDESYIITYNDRPSRANMQPIANSVWFAKLKDSPKYLIVKDFSTDLLNSKIFSTGFCGFSIKKEQYNLIATYIISDLFDKDKNSLCIGATMQAVNNESIKSILIPDFTDKDYDKYNDIAESKFNLIYNINQENKKLNELKQLYLKKFFG